MKEEEEQSEGTAEGKNIDPLHQLITLFHQSALTERRCVLIACKYVCVCVQALGTLADCIDK